MTCGRVSATGSRERMVTVSPLAGWQRCYCCFARWPGLPHSAARRRKSSVPASTYGVLIYWRVTMSDREKVQLSAVLVLLCPAFAWFASAKFYYGFTPDNVHERVGFLLTHTFSLWPLWGALLAGLALGVVG